MTTDHRRLLFSHRGDEQAGAFGGGVGLETLVADV